MKRILSSVLGSAVLLAIVVAPVSAHVVVKPDTVGVGAFQTFTMSVPVEQDQPTIALRLLIPEGLEFVTPNVKPGWTITIKKTGEGESAKVTEITWTAGSIPTGQRDEFVFSAKAPSKTTDLQWKAYQTSKDGSVVSWDVTPSTEKMDTDDDSAKTGPYSVTKVIDDLSPAPTTLPPMASSETSPKVKAALLASLGISAAALAIALRKK
ncbi:MAG: YcnI family protein [Candidatus Woesebacteria bacterium]